MNSNKLSVIFLNLFIISFPLSVTLSQSFGVLSILFFLLNSILNKNLLVILKNRAFLAGFSLYFSILPSFFWNLSNYESSVLSIPLKSELSDFWMSFLILPSFYHIRNLEHRDSIFRSFYISAFLIVLTGLISIFTPFRLAPFITAGFVVKEGVRLQHFAGDILGIYTYLPIGLMNTHLTFGGLCGLLFPGLSFHLILGAKTRKFWKNLILLIFIIVFGIVIFYNQSRSIWLGIVFTFGIIITKLVYDSNFKFLNWKYAVYGLGIIFVISITSISIYKKNWLLQRAFQESLADNTTENQRYFIYKNTMSLINDHWLMGIGPGRFESVHRDKSNQMIQKNEQLWYELYITPRQHAHHDLLHFYAIGGLFGLVGFLYLWFYLFKFFFRSLLTKDNVLFGGLLVMFIAGFFQCYLLDDEVTLPFFAIVGFLVGSFQKEENKIRKLVVSRKKNNNSDSFYVESTSFESSFNFLKKYLGFKIFNISFDGKNILYFLFVLTPILISLFYIFFKIRLEPMQVYKRKVTIHNLEDKKYIYQSLSGKQTVYPTVHMTENNFIRIEGCLSHRFTNPISIRNTPYIFELIFLEDTQNPPKDVVVRIIERDSFDQDKLYKVHKLKPIGIELIFPIMSSGKNLIKIEDSEIYSNVLESNQFPQNIYFRDFELQFRGFDKSKDFFDLPIINFGNLCDLN